MQTTDHTHGNGAPPGPEFPTRILVAEDNPFNRKMAEMMLTRSGFEVELAGTGQEAVDKYTADPDRFHFILMDIQMPEMDGVAATRTIRERGDAPTFRRLEAGTTPAGSRHHTRWLQAGTPALPGAAVDFDSDFVTGTTPAGSRHHKWVSARSR